MKHKQLKRKAKTRIKAKAKQRIITAHPKHFKWEKENKTTNKEVLEAMLKLAKGVKKIQS